MRDLDHPCFVEDMARDVARDLTSDQQEFADELLARILAHIERPVDDLTPRATPELTPELRRIFEQEKERITAEVIAEREERRRLLDEAENEHARAQIYAEAEERDLRDLHRGASGLARRVLPPRIPPSPVLCDYRRPVQRPRERRAAQRRASPARSPGRSTDDDPSDHVTLDRAWLEAVERDDAQDELAPRAVLPFALLRWMFGHLAEPWAAFDELPATTRWATWTALKDKR